jgi:hypothetical protein
MEKKAYKKIFFGYSVDLVSQELLDFLNSNSLKAGDYHLITAHDRSIDGLVFKARIICVYHAEEELF